MNTENNKNNLKVNHKQSIKHPIITLKKLIHPIFLGMMPSKRDFEPLYFNYHICYIETR